MESRVEKESVGNQEKSRGNQENEGFDKKSGGIRRNQEKPYIIQ